METWLELILVGLLVTTLVHAIRLQRAIVMLRHDRAELDAAVAGFDAGTRQAEQGAQRMRDGAQSLARQIDDMTALKDDLSFLTERGTQVADRLDTLVRAARPAVGPAPVQHTPPPASPPVRSQAERDLLLALRGQQ